MTQLPTCPTIPHLAPRRFIFLAMTIERIQDEPANIREEKILQFPQAKNTQKPLFPRITQETALRTGTILVGAVTIGSALGISGRMVQEIEKDKDQHQQKVERAHQIADEKFPLIETDITDTLKVNLETNGRPYIVQDQENNRQQRHREITRQGGTEKYQTDKKKLAALTASTFTALVGIPAVLLGVTSAWIDAKRRNQLGI